MIDVNQSTALQQSIKEELEQYRRQHQKLKLLFNITRSISRELVIDRLLRLIMDEVKSILNCDRCTIFILDDEREELWARIAHGDEEIRFPCHMGMAGYVASSGEALNIPDAYADDRFNPNIDRKTGYHTFNALTVPMRNSRGEIIAVFQALNKFSGPFNRDDEELLDAICVISATQIENAQLYEEQKKTFDSLVETLASTIDARDPMTAGHSKRIALYADEIARIVKLTDSEREVLRTSAMLHDYGKIAVREAILTKTERLTLQEFEHIQKHPEYTRKILENINFSRELKDVPKIAAAHHEKLDGSGYPLGLVDGQIPKLSKILAVVDVFDALTSERPYRDRMKFFQVLRIISDGSGTHFDEFFVAAFKKIKLSRLLEILENDFSEYIDANDLRQLSRYDLTDLGAAIRTDKPDVEQEKMRDLFLRYYSRTYLKEKNVDPTYKYE